MDSQHGHIHSTPILPVTSVAETTTFYRRLGLDVTLFDEGYAWVTRDGHEILHLRKVDDLKPAQNHSSAYFHVANADRLHAAWTAAGITIGELADMPWRMREFSLVDPSGNLLRVGHDL